MDTRDFLELILPSGGNKVLALAKPKTDGPGFWFKYYSYPTVEQAAEAAEQFDAKGETVFFGVNGFGDWYDCPKKNKRRIRTQENVVACRSLFDDFDVDPDDDKKYSTQLEALQDAIRLAQAIRLTPTITSSGGGVHVYFTLDQDVDDAEWMDLAALKRDITAHLGIKADRAVDMDVARILRPAGTHNHKFDPPRQVEVLRQGKVYPAEKVRENMEQYIRDNDVPPAPRPSAKSDVANPFAAALGDHPPSDANLVADRCAAVREFRDRKGDIPEPHWHRAIGAIKECTNGEELIHEWSSGYEGYSYEETQTKIDEWDVGPTSCVEMDRHVGCLATCPLKESCKFPIQLGVSDQAPSVEEETTGEVAQAAQAVTPQPIIVEGQNIPYWPSTGFRWNGSTLSRAFTDPDGITTWRPFCQDFVYPLNRIRDSEGTWVIHWRTKEKNGRWREFFMPTSELAALDKMAATMAANEVFLVRTAKARSDMAEFAETLIKTLQEWRIETETVKQFGWTEDYSGFIMGTTKITASGEEQVLCDPDLPPDVAVDFGTSGTLEEWVENIDKLYNRPGAEPFQFALCHSMGSCLVELFGSSNWHGLPLAFTGSGGTGKTTASRIAVGFYGKPKLMERQTGDQGSTLNAMIKRIAFMGALPMLLDEFSGRTPEELTRTGYALANGRDKERLGSSGKFSTTGGEWFKNSLITSNDGIHEAISKLPAGYKVEATQLRFFEIQLPDGFRNKIFPDIDQTFVEHHMDSVYGHACRPFIQFVIKHHDWVRRQIVAARSRFNPKDEEDNKERFYRDTIVTAYVAGKIAEKLGLISFDLKAMKNWATDQVINMRGSRKETNVATSEHVARYLASLRGRLIVTRRMADGRSKKASPEAPLEMLRADAVGRVCLDDRLVYVSTGSVQDYCREYGITATVFREELESQGLLIKAPDGGSSRMVRIVAGTTEIGTPMRCYELDYGKLTSGSSLKLVATGAGKQKGEENA